MQMPLLSLKNDRLPLFFESQDPEECVKTLLWITEYITKRFVIHYEVFELSPLCLGRHGCNKYFPLQAAFTITLQSSVFLIQYLDVCAKKEANEKECVLNSTRDKCSRRSACVERDVSARIVLWSFHARTHSVWINRPGHPASPKSANPKAR